MSDADRPADLTPQYQRLARAQKGTTMLADDAWRWSQLDYSPERDIQTIQIESLGLTGYFALSNDGREWHYFVPDGELLVRVATEAEARARPAAIPENGQLHLPESMYARHLRIWHQGDGILMGLYAPTDPNNAPAWPSVTSLLPGMPATEATMREILAELRKLNGRIIS